MITASISEAKNKLSALIDRVRMGETVLITDRGTPVATLQPAQPTDDERIARLERAGIVRPPRRRNRGRSRLLDSPPPGPATGTGAVDALIAERREGR